MIHGLKTKLKLGQPSKKGCVIKDIPIQCSHFAIWDYFVCLSNLGWGKKIGFIINPHLFCRKSVIWLQASVFIAFCVTDLQYS